MMFIVMKLNMVVYHETLQVWSNDIKRRCQVSFGTYTDCTSGEAAGPQNARQKPLDPSVVSRIKAQIIICYIFSRQIMNKHNSFQPFHLPFPNFQEIETDKEIHFKKKNNEQRLLPLSCNSCTAARRSRLSPNVKDPQPRLRKSSRSVWDRSLTSAAIPNHSRNSLEELGADSSGYICGREAAGRPTFWCLQQEGFGQAPQDRDLLHPKSAHSCNIGWQMHIELQRAKQNGSWIMF